MLPHQMSSEKRSELGRRSGASRNRARREIKQVSAGMSVRGRSGATYSITHVHPGNGNVTLNTGTVYSANDFLMMFEVVK